MPSPLLKREGMMPQTSTLNTLNTSKCKCVISRITHVNYWIQTFALPGLQIESAILPSPRRDIPLPGSKFEYDPLQMLFIVDQNMDNYMEIIRWANEFQDTTTNITDLMSTVTFTMLNGDNVGVFEAQLKNAFPVTISELDFITNETTMMPSTCNVTFRYSHINYTNLNSNIGI